jgi:DNA-binding MurR/RpiR family transcriptional regulator
VYQQRIREIYGQLSPGYRRIADFLLNRYQDAAFMTAAQVGKAADVDTTLVVRFAQRLGYPGFPELIDDIQADVKRDLRAVYQSIPEDSTPAGIVQQTMVQDRNNLEYVLLHTDSATIQKVVESLDNAGRIFVAGEGDTMLLAAAFATRLTLLGIPAHTVFGELAARAAITAGVKPGDVFVGIGTTPLALTVSMLLKLARQAGAQTIAVVGNSTNPIATAADHVILAPAGTVGLMPCWTALAAVLHGLVQAVISRRPDQMANWVARTDQLLRAYVEQLETSIPSLRDVVAEYSATQQLGLA